MALKNLLGLTLAAKLTDLAGGILGRRKALQNLGIPTYIFSILKSISHLDVLNPTSNEQALSAKDLFGIRNLKSLLQAQVDSFLTKIQQISALLSKTFPNNQAKSTIAVLSPVSGLQDLEMSSKIRITYNSQGVKIGETPEPIQFEPVTSTTCKLNLGPTNGVSTTPSASNSQSLPLYKNQDFERISDFDTVTIEWEEQQVAGQPKVKKRRTDMQVNGPFYSSEEWWNYDFKMTEKLGNFVFELDLTRGTGDNFDWLIANLSGPVNCKIIKKSDRVFKCATNCTIPSSLIASIQRTDNLTTVIFKDTYDFLGDPALAANNPADDRIVKNQPIVVRATGLLADFAGSYRIQSVERQNRLLRYQNISASEPNTTVIQNPNVEISISPFYSEEFRPGETINVTVTDPNTRNAVLYKDFIVGESFIDGPFKGFYLYGNSNVNYSLMYHFEKALSWGFRQAAIINNFANSKLVGGEKSLTARQFIRGYSSGTMPSPQHGNTLGTSKKSLWNRTTRAQSGIVQTYSFPGEVQINGSLEVQQEMAFGTNAALLQNPVLGEGSIVSPYYEYFNKQKDITHFFRLKIGGGVYFLPANTFEEQVFKHEREVITRSSSLSQTAIVALDKFYTSGNKFVFARGGTLKSSANQTNIFFGDIFQPLLRATSETGVSPYRGIYANIMPYREGFVATKELTSPTQETSNPDLNKYYQTINGNALVEHTYVDSDLTPAKTINWAYVGLSPKQVDGLNEDLSTLVPTNSATIILVFRIRPDWTEARPNNGAVEDQNTPQVIMSQGVDWEVLKTRFAGSTSDTYFTDNGLGWVLYTSGWDNSNREIIFTNPGPWMFLRNTGGTFKWGGTNSEPTRVAGFDSRIALTKRLQVNKWHFLALTFKTTESNTSSAIMTDTDMLLKQTASLTPAMYPNAGSSFVPTQAFIDEMRPTEIQFYVGQGNDQTVSATPGSNLQKIIRGTVKNGTSINRFGRAFGVGIPQTPQQVYGERDGVNNLASWQSQGNLSYARRSHVKYRVSCPMDVAFLAQMNDIMTGSQLAEVYKSLKTGTFKDFDWGSPA